MVKSVGILGGAFDPVHHGHLRLALEAQQQLNLDEIRLIPVCSPPHRREPIASPGQRLSMLKLATDNNQQLVVDDCEIRRGGISYSIDTLNEIREKNSDQSLCFIIGMDAFQNIHTWHKSESLLDNAHIVIADRPGSKSEFKNGKVSAFFHEHFTDDYKIITAKNCGNIIKINTPMLEISSTEIRKYVAAKINIRYLLPDSVITYINNESLYQ